MNNDKIVYEKQIYVGTLNGKKRYKHIRAESKKELKQKENKTQNGSGRSPRLNNHSKCKWIELPNQKTQSGRMDQRTRPNNMLPPENTPQPQRETST